MAESSINLIAENKIEYLRKCLIGKNVYEIIGEINSLKKEDLESKLEHKYKNILNKDTKIKLLDYSLVSQSNKEEKQFFVGTDFVLDDYDVLKTTKLLNEKVLTAKLSNIICAFYNGEKLEDCKLIVDFILVLHPNKLDFYIFQNDYDYILDKLNSHNYSIDNYDTMYIGVKEVLNQTPLFPEYKLIIKSSYLSFVLNNENLKTISKIGELNNSYEEYVSSHVSSFIGKSDAELCNFFNLIYDNRKSQWIELAYNMLQISSNRAKELTNCNISLRTLRIEENNKMRESIPLPPIKLKQFAKEEWKNSILYNYFNKTKFLFFVFKKEAQKYIFKGIQFWTMSEEDLNIIVFDGWNKIRNVINKGIVFTLINTSNGIVVKNNLPSKKDNAIIHMRPHAKKAYYKINNGYVVGDITDGDELPDGQWITKQSFWINNSYILSILDKRFFGA